MNESVVVVNNGGGVNDLNEISPVPTSTSQQVVTTNLTALQQNVLVTQFITPVGLGVAVIPAGIQQFKLHFTKAVSSHLIQVYVKITHT
ncbi:hypothetical protein ABK046_47635, partial [Streptomyces caeruleatus]